MKLISLLASLTFLISFTSSLIVLYKKKEKECLNQAEGFKKYTQKLLKNQKGSLFIFAILITQIVLGFLLHWLLINLQTKSRIEVRSKTYLCAQQLMKREKKFLSYMAMTNMAIRAAFIARKVPQTAIAADRLFQLLKLKQNVYHLNRGLLKRKSKYCPSKVLSYWALSSPYKNKGMTLKREIDGTAILKKKEWKRWITLNGFGKYKNRVPKKYWFMLQFKIKAKSKFQKRPFFQIKEIAILDFTNWR